MSVGNLNFVELASGSLPLENVALRLHPDDQVAIAKVNLAPNARLTFDDQTITIKQLISSGHKIAIRAVKRDESVRRYGQIIGFATQDIAPGDHVHIHNIEVRDFARDYAFGSAVTPVDYVPEKDRLTFMGYKRSNGRVGTRNYIAVISTVNCSAHVCNEIAHYFTPERLAPYPNVDGVIAITHHAGCASRVGSLDYDMLQLTLAGIARHANVAAYLLIGLGCETNQTSELVANYKLEGDSAPAFTIQGQGGVRKTIEAGVLEVERLLPIVNRCERTPQPMSELVIGLQCGGSDSWSGVTANPALGRVADEIVRQGGTVVLAETPEIYGAEPMLTRRAVSEAVGQKLIDKVHWWEQHAERLGLEINNNPSAGNKVGGLTTIYEKSLGAAAKAGTTPLTAVYDYAEPITDRGFTFMDSPGYDPVSVTGQVAGGCNIIIFTTGRGSAFGFKPSPSIKVVSNSTTYNHMSDDMDVNAGKILEGTSLDEVAAELLDLTIRVASGQPSKSEAQGIGESEFSPWGLGGIL
jgi:altronate hydrolase